MIGMNAWKMSKRYMSILYTNIYQRIQTFTDRIKSVVLLKTLFKECRLLLGKSELPRPADPTLIIFNIACSRGGFLLMTITNPQVHLKVRSSAILG